jgi:F-type H+-transporting ATPase subunit b
MLKIDLSLFIQIANFLLLLFLLNIFLYRPIRRVLNRRRDETDSLQKTIEDYHDRSDRNERGIEEGVVQARKDGFEEKENLKGQAVEEEKAILREAVSSVEEKKAEANRELGSKMADVKKILEEQVAGFSQELAEKILGRSIHD